MSNATRAASLLLALFLIACGGSGEISWQEQVQLSDGHVVLVDRTEQYHDTQEIGGIGERHIDRATLTLMPSGPERLPTLTVGVDPANAAKPTGELPFAFDVDSSTHDYFVITIVDHCYRAQELGLGRMPYLEYRLQDGRWNRAPVSAAREGWKANLLIGKSIVKAGEVVSLAQKAARDGNGRLDIPYRKVSNGC